MQSQVKKTIIEEYWLTKLSGELTTISLPFIHHTDIKKEKTNVKHQPPVSFSMEIPAAISMQLRRAAKNSDIALLVLFLSGLNILLTKYTGIDDLIVGTIPPAANGNDNIIFCRSVVPGHMTVKELILKTKEVMLEAVKYSEYSLDDMVEALQVKKNINHLDIFNVVILYEPFQERNEYLDRFGFVVIFSSVNEGLCLHMRVPFSSSHEVARNLGRSLITAFARMLESTGQRISHLEILNHEEKNRLLYEFNSTEADYPGDKPLQQLFVEQAGENPDRIAAAGQGQYEVDREGKNREKVQLTYKELNKKSDQLAGLLLKKGVKPETIAAIMMERSVEILVGIYGILKAGGAYLPIDPQYPQDRIKYMLEDSSAKILVTTPVLFEKFEKLSTVSCQLLMINEKLPGRPGLNTSPQKANSINNLQLEPPNLAYVIYTSGSTGSPKGVTVEHRPVVNVLWALQKAYPCTRSDIYLLKTSFLFDVSITELFGWFIGGGRLVLLQPGGEKNPPVIVETVEYYSVTHINFVPSMFSAFEEFLHHQNIHRLSSLKYIFLAGESLLPGLVKRFQCFDTHIPGLRLENLYGPTEGTVYSTKYSLLDWNGSGSVPIGKPLPNVKLYILDKSGHLKPVGVPGELCISGVGLTRGYLNRPQLTAEKFLSVRNMSYKSYRSYISKKIYKTGDWARWLLDGNIEFLGRIDHQVKIRGYRVELGETEKQLLKHKDIKQAVVVMKQHLCAYIVSHRDINIKGAKLRKFLSQQLPDYMIPGFFVQMEELPLNPNGKINREALPDPEPGETMKSYEPPGNEIEKRLVEVWSQVLGGEIGINDNFFSLGGDSIKAIQVTARLRKYRLDLKINDLFKHPVIKEQAKYTRTTVREIDQGIVQEEVPLTPIQRWFFDNDFTAKHHFNQAVMLYREKGFDEKILTRVFNRLLEHHDALRMVYRFNHNRHEGNGVPGQGNIIQENKGIEKKLFDFEVFNFEDKDKTKIEKEIPNAANRIQESIDLEHGPLVKLGLFKSPGGDHLLIVIHHLVVDGVSWRILLEDLDIGYRQGEQGKAVKFQEKTNSFKYWSQQLTRYATGDAGEDSRMLLNQLAYWKELQNVKIDTLPGKREIEREKRKQKYMNFISVSMSDVETEDLLKKVNWAYNTEINDILLAALGMAVQQWADVEKVLIHLEGHGRESIIQGIDINRTVGWFTALYPVVLDMSRCQELSYTIKSVKETLRCIPDKGIGYGILKYLTPAEKKKGTTFELEPEIIFNYLGQFNPFDREDREGDGQDIGSAASFQFSRVNTGQSTSLHQEQKHALSINGMVVDGNLKLSFSYNTYEYERVSIQALVDNFKSQLLRIIRHCSQKQEKQLTPGDVMDPRYCRLSLHQFLRITNHIKNNIPGNPAVLSIYPLSPMQKGILYHVLSSEDYDVYFIQSVFQLQGALDASLLEAGFNRLMERYDIFRTIFYYEGLEEPLQIVLTHRKVQLHYEDISNLPENEQTRHLEESRKKDKERRFNLGKDTLMRLTLFKTGRRVYHLVWSYHHILMDGWCLGIIYKELVQIYQGLKESEYPQLGVVTPYRDYIEWLLRQDKTAGLRYWQKYLEGYDRQTGLPKSRLGKPVKESYYKLAVSHLEIGNRETTALNWISRKYRVTVNTVFQTLWGILLGGYNNCSDVVFGAVVSGRPVEIPGIENMVGLFINTVPVRINTRPDQDFSLLLRILQERSISSRSYEYLSLAEIQANSRLKANPIDHIMIFESYPLQEQLKEINTAYPRIPAVDFKVEDLRINEQTNYDFNVIIHPHRPFLVQFSYNALVYETNFVTRVGLHLIEIIKQVTDDPGIKVKEIEIITPEEKQRILFDFNRTSAGYPANKVLHQLFEEQVERTPGYTALVAMDHPRQGTYKEMPFIASGPGKQNMHFTYNQLNKKSNQLAYLLLEKGIQPDNIVGIMIKRSIEIIIGILGILKAGGAYLPIDTEYPGERIAYMMADSRPKALVTTHELFKEDRKLGNWNGDKIFLNVGNRLTCSADQPAGSPQPAASPFNLAYVIYTSGSTGNPKGVLIRHQGVVNMAWFHRRLFSQHSRSRISQVSAASFDAMASEIWPCLLAGANLCIVDNETRMDSQRLKEWLIKYQITFSFQSTLVAQQLLEEQWPAAGVSLEVLTTAGDRLVSYPTHGYPFRFYNLYGPTEDTIWTTWKEVPIKPTPDGKLPPIGKPVANKQVVILNQDLKLQPVGVMGELCISGDGVARGYLNNPELTAEKFDHDFWDLQDYQDEKQKVPGKNYEHHMQPPPHHSPQYPITPLPRSPIYRTGDLARWLPDGDIEFLGRIDRQVKLRGYRIEPGEIESRLLEHPQVKEAVVAVKEAKGNKVGTSETGEYYLCAYVVSGQRLNCTALKDTLAMRLPHYMIPVWIIQVERMPLTVSGKVDWRRLPDPRETVGYQHHVPPQNNTQDLLAHTWAAVLGVDKGKIGIDSDFFQLGGHSLTIVKLVNKINQTFQVNIPLPEVFKRPTIRALGEFVQQVKQYEYSSIKPAAKKEYYPLSSSQKRLYFLWQMDPASTGYNLPQAIIIEGKLDKKSFQGVFRALVARHETLHTSIQMVEGKPVQKIHENVEFELEYYDMKEVEEEWSSAVAISNPLLAAPLISSFIRPFDLTHVPLLRVGLVQMAEDKHLFLLDLHHIISDGVSEVIFIRELIDLYEGRTLPELPLQYKDYSEWQNRKLETGEINRQKEYWLNRFNVNIPILNMYTDYRRQDAPAFHGDKIPGEIGPGLTGKIKDLTMETDITLFMVLLAAWYILLSKYTNQEDITVGIPAAGRSHPDLEHIVGMFVNTLAMRNYPGKERDFADFLQEVKTNALEAYENQDYPFDDLVNQLGIPRKGQRNPLFDVLFVSENIDIPEMAVKGLRFRPYSFKHPIAHMDLVLYFIAGRETIHLLLEYSTGLFKEETAKRILKNYTEILTQVVANRRIAIKDITISHKFLIARPAILQEEDVDFTFREAV